MLLSPYQAWPLEVPVRMCFSGLGVDSEEWLWTRRRVENRGSHQDLLIPRGLVVCCTAGDETGGQGLEETRKSEDQNIAKLFG